EDRLLVRGQRRGLAVLLRTLEPGQLGIRQRPGADQEVEALLLRPLARVLHLLRHGEVLTQIGDVGPDEDRALALAIGPTEGAQWAVRPRDGAAGKVRLRVR